MKLREIVVEQAILPNLNASDRDEAIAQIINAMVDAGAVSDDHREEFTNAVIKREKRASTGFGHGVAVPHVKHSAINSPMIGIGVSHEGVDFNALDNQPVYTIVLLLSPEDRPENHLDAMEAIFGNLSQEVFRRFLRQAQSVEDVLTLLEEADDKTSVR